MTKTFSALILGWWIDAYLKDFDVNRAVDITNEDCVKIVHIRSFCGLYFYHVRPVYEDLQSNSSYPVRMQEIRDQKNLELDTFHAVEIVAKSSKTLRSKNIAVKTEFRDLRTRPFTQSLARKLKKTADFLFVKHHTIRTVLGNVPMHLNFLPWSFPLWIFVLVLCKNLSN